MEPRPEKPYIIIAGWFGSMGLCCIAFGIPNICWEMRAGIIFFGFDIIIMLTDIRGMLLHGEWYKDRLLKSSKPNLFE